MGQNDKILTCANGSAQCAYMEHDEVMGPSISMERTLLTAVIEAQEGYDVPSNRVLSKDQILVSCSHMTCCDLLYTKITLHINLHILLMFLFKA